MIQTSPWPRAPLPAPSVERTRRRLRLFRTGARVLAVMAALAACTPEDGARPNLLSGVDLSPRAGRQGSAGRQVTGREATQLVYLDAEGAAAPAAPGITPGENGYSVNLQAVPVADAARSLLGDVLGQPYSLDPAATGTITMATGRPVPRDQLLMIFEEALAANGLVLLDGGGQIVIRRDDGAQRPANVGGAGYGLTAIPLRNVPADRMLTLLDGFAADSGDLRASARDDVILVRGTARDRAALADIVGTLDVGLMARQDTGIAFLKNSSAQAVGASLDELQRNDGAASGWKFQVLAEANAILVVAGDRADLSRAMTWIERLDRAGSTESAEIHVYQVQFARASNLASILETTFAGGTAPASVAVAAPAATLGEAAAAQDGGADQGLSFPAEVAGRSAATAVFSAGAAGEVRFIANDADNTIVIRAPANIRRDALALLAALDRAPVQVLIEVMLVEVTLNDATRFGVQAYLSGSDASLIGTAGDSTTIAPQAPGFNVILGAATSPRMIIDSLEQVTTTRVISAPSVVAFENEEAEIKVVDQVPITTQQVVGTQTADAPLVNTIEYRDAGVILRVTPQVSESDLVNLTVKQELSAVLSDAADETLTPRLRQRSLSTQVAVYDNQTVTLGGLISTQSARDRKGTPLLGILGGGRKARSDSRTELLIFITPHVVRNQKDAAAVSEELRSKMTEMTGQ